MNPLPVSSDRLTPPMPPIDAVTAVCIVVVALAFIPWERIQFRGRR